MELIIAITTLIDHRNSYETQSVFCLQEKGNECVCVCERERDRERERERVYVREIDRKRGTD